MDGQSEYEKRSRGHFAKSMFMIPLSVHVRLQTT
jgi:hypothetical protein